MPITSITANVDELAIARMGFNSQAWCNNRPSIRAAAPRWRGNAISVCAAAVKLTIFLRGKIYLHF